MKTMDRLYERLTPTERFQIAVSAFGRGDIAEVDRLNDSTAYREVKIQEPAYFDRLQRIVWLTLYFMVDARNLQIGGLAAFSALTICELRSEGRADDGEASEDDARIDALMDLCWQRASRLKALHAAWEEFCTGLAVSAGDIDKMIGIPFMGGLGQIELVQKVVGQIPPDEEYQRECLHHMKTLWTTNLADRHTRFR